MLLDGIAREESISKFYYSVLLLFIVKIFIGKNMKMMLEIIIVSNYVSKLFIVGLNVSIDAQLYSKDFLIYNMRKK